MPPRKPNPSANRGKTTTYGFKQAGGLVSRRLKQASASRGFSEAKVLTQWDSIVGPAIARIARPEKVAYAKGGLGATLIVVTEGAHGPELQMQLPVIRERVNACYGYNAISRVRITQVSRTAPTMGFAEPRAQFDNDQPPPDAEPLIRSLDLDNVKNDGLRDALEKLGNSVVRRKTLKKTGFET